MKKKSLAILLIVVLLAAMLAACSKGKEAGEKPTDVATVPTAKKEPVELVFYAQIYSEQNFIDEYQIPLKKKFPHVTLKYIKKGKGQELPDLITAGTIPDIFYTNSAQFAEIKNSELDFDLTALIKQYSLDLNKFEPGVIETVRSFGEGTIPGIPIFLTPHVLHYNKDIFDKFGVPYPKDNMTWKQLVDVARSVSRVSDGQVIRGFEFQTSPAISFNQLSLPVVDPKTNKAVVNNEKWKNLFQTFKALYEVPNNQPDEKTIGAESEPFLTDKTLAMRAGHNKIWNLPKAIEGGLNFDMVTLPHFPEAPNKGPQSVSVMLSISPLSKHKEQIFEMLSYLVSEENQIRNGRSAGNLTVLKNQKVKDQYLADVDFMKGKNIGALTKPGVAPPVAYSPYTGKANGIMHTEFKEYLLNKKDVNTALRVAEEKINLMIQSEMEKEKAAKK